MQITSVTYANEEETMLTVVTSDMGTLHVPWPCETWHKEPIDEWIAVPNTIAAWTDPVDYMALMRATRDSLLTACDWTQLSDCQLTAQQVTDYATYRQSLRDMPQDNPGTTTKALYDALTWPTEPTV